MITTNTILIILLSHHAAAFSTTSYLPLAPRAISRSAGIHINLTKPPRSAGCLRMSSSSVAVSPPEEEPTPKTEPLFEGIGKGIVRDYKARLPLYGSDIKDGLNTQVCFYR